MPLFNQTPFSGSADDKSPPGPAHPPVQALWAGMYAPVRYAAAALPNEDYRNVTKPNYKPLPPSPAGSLKAPPRIAISPPVKQ